MRSKNYRSELLRLDILGSRTFEIVSSGRVAPRSECNKDGELLRKPLLQKTDEDGPHESWSDAERIAQGVG